MRRSQGTVEKRGETTDGRKPTVLKRQTKSEGSRLGMTLLLHGSIEVLSFDLQPCTKRNLLLLDSHVSPETIGPDSDITQTTN